MGSHVRDATATGGLTKELRIPRASPSLGFEEKKKKERQETTVNEDRWKG
jgi:hypothetical protein